MTDNMPDQGVKVEEKQENYLSQLVGEGNKYANEEALAKGAYNADKHIQKLEAETAELREKLNMQSKQEEHLSTIVDLLKPKEEVVEEPKQVDPVVIKEEVKQPQTPDVSITEVEQAAKFAELGISKFGSFDVAKTQLMAYIGDDEAKRSMVTTMMRTDPNALINILPEVEVPKEGSLTTDTSMTTQPNPAISLTWTEAEKVLKEDPDKYRSDEYQSLIAKAWNEADKLGIKFTET